MSVYTVLEKREIAQLAEDYGLGKVGKTEGIVNAPTHTSYRLDTAKGRYVLRIDEVKSEIDVRREIDLLLYLRKHGFPCPQLVVDRKGRQYHEHGGRCVALYKFVDGRARETRHLTFGQIENAGRVLADLHVIGKGYKKGVDNRFNFERVAEVYQEVRNRLPSYFKRITRTLDEEVAYLEHYLEGKLPKGIIHGDLYLDNIMFRGEKVVNVVEFEQASRGKYIFDLATAVNALCFDGERYDLKRFEALIGGYESLRTLSLAEWDAFPNELRFSALRFTVNLLSEFFANPFDDSKRINKDFREFYDRLRILRREREGGMEGLLMAMATGYDYRKYQKVRAIEKKGKSS